MSAASAPAPTSENRVVLRVDTGPVGPSVLARVVAMMLARADCPIDRLDDALLVAETLAAHAPAHLANGRVEFTIATHVGALELRVGALGSGGARALLADAELPGIGSVIEPIADSLRIESSADGREAIVLELGFEPAGAGERRSGAPRA